MDWPRRRATDAPPRPRFFHCAKVRTVSFILSPRPSVYSGDTPALPGRRLTTAAAQFLNTLQPDDVYDGGTCPLDNFTRYCGASSLMFPRRFRGNSSSAFTPKALAITKSSRSVTRRSWFSSRVTDSRLVSHPDNCNFKASRPWVHPLSARSFRTWGPITLRFEASLLMLGTVTSAADNPCELYRTLKLALVREEAYTTWRRRRRMKNTDSQTTRTALTGHHWLCLAPVSCCGGAVKTGLGFLFLNATFRLSGVVFHHFSRRS